MQLAATLQASSCTDTGSRWPNHESCHRIDDVTQHCRQAAALMLAAAGLTMNPVTTSMASRNTAGKLASQGTNFINTYCASPQCVPSRTTMFTG
jgi:hypothetical protein